MSLWEFINPGDSYEKGYECGFEDGKTPNKKRNAPWTEEIKYATAIWNREAFWKSFHDGYNKGFTDGLRERNNLYKDNENNINNNLNKNSMPPRNSSIDYQIELLEELKKSLESFSSNLDAVVERYGKKLENLQNNGLLTELYEHYHSTCYEPTKTRVNGLKQNIIENDLVEINRIIDRLNLIV